MSDSPGDFFIPPPAFQPEQALQTLKRFLRDQRQLSEHSGNSFRLKGLTVLELAVDDAMLSARLARRPQQVPEWDRKVCSNSAQLRALQDEIKRRLTRWSDDEQ